MDLKNTTFALPYSLFPNILVAIPSNCHVNLGNKKKRKQTKQQNVPYKIYVHHEVFQLFRPRRYFNFNISICNFILLAGPSRNVVCANYRLNASQSASQNAFDFLLGSLCGGSKISKKTKPAMNLQRQKDFRFCFKCHLKGSVNHVHV